MSELFDKVYRARKSDKKDLDEIKQLISEATSHQINYVNRREQNTTPLILALMQGKTDIARELLNHKSIDVEIESMYGVTALMVASYIGSLDLVEKILSKYKYIAGGDSAGERISYQLAQDNTSALDVASNSQIRYTISKFMGEHACSNIDLINNPDFIISSARDSNNQLISYCFLNEDIEKYLGVYKDHEKFMEKIKPFTMTEGDLKNLIAEYKNRSKNNKEARNAFYDLIQLYAEKRNKDDAPRNRVRNRFDSDSSDSDNFI